MLSLGLEDSAHAFLGSLLEEDAQGRVAARAFAVRAVPLVVRLKARARARARAWAEGAWD